jgi:hypothetical protein
MTNDNLGALNSTWERREGTYTLKLNIDQKDGRFVTVVRDCQRSVSNQWKEASPTEQRATEAIIHIQ